MADADFLSLLLDSCNIQRKTRLAVASDINDSVTVIPANSVSGAATSGTITIGAEAITYTAVDTGANTFGTVAAPATRGAMGTTAASHSTSDDIRDAGGHRIFAWVNNATAVACRIETARRQELEQVTNEKTVIDPKNVMLPALTSLTEDDRITSSGNTYSVLRVLRGDDVDSEHHVEAILDIVKAA